MEDPIPINLAVEDPLSEAMAYRLLRLSPGRFAVGTVFSRGGNGYLKKIIGGLNNAAKAVPCLVLTDLDREECPPTLIRNWLPQPLNANLLIRVAVTEVEAWILADRSGFAAFAGIALDRIPPNVDTVRNAKEYLIELARSSRKRGFRDAIVPRKGSTARVGQSYNETLARFVERLWDVDSARVCSESLARAVTAVESFRPSWRNG